MEELCIKRIIGLMSGTSCDSIDVGLCEVGPDLSCTLIDGFNYKYPENVRKIIFKFFSGEVSLQDVCKYNFVIGKCFADAANLMIKKHGKPDIISSHGQTVYHYPFDNKFGNISLKSTLQLGESSIIAKETGVLTVSNFREKDIACGGDGAPLVCFADDKWFKPLKRNVAVQNIGGISNVTVVSKKFDTFGFDTGCGNIMLDYCCNKFFNVSYDKNGEIAKSGKVCESWLSSLLEDEYYYLSPPKTTGREYFSPKYVENILKSAPKNKEDIIATLTALIAKTISQSYERFVYPNVDLDEVILGGGGAYNPEIKKYLRLYLPNHIQIKSHEDYGISNNFKEVMAFAVLGYCTYFSIPNNLPSCTGACERTVLGKITLP